MQFCAERGCGELVARGRCPRHVDTTHSVKGTFRQRGYTILCAEQREAERKQKLEPPRCPGCGSYHWTYNGDRQVCVDCGR